MTYSIFATDMLTDFFTRRRDARTVRSSLVCQGEPVPTMPEPVQRRSVRRRLRFA